MLRQAGARKPPIPGGRMFAATRLPRTMPRISGILRHCRWRWDIEIPACCVRGTCTRGTVPKRQHGAISACDFAGWVFGGSEPMRAATLDSGAPHASSPLRGKHASRFVQSALPRRKRRAPRGPSAALACIHPAQGGVTLMAAHAGTPPGLTPWAGKSCRRAAAQSSRTLACDIICKSQIPNPKSQIPNPKSEILNLPWGGFVSIAAGAR